MSAHDWKFRDPRWCLVDEHGAVLGTLEHDRETQCYRDNNGMLRGRRFDDACAVIQDEAAKPPKVRRGK